MMPSSNGYTILVEHSPYVKGFYVIKNKRKNSCFVLSLTNYFDAFDLSHDASQLTCSTHRHHEIVHSAPIFARLAVRVHDVDARAREGLRHHREQTNP